MAAANCAIRRAHILNRCNREFEYTSPIFGVDILKISVKAAKKEVGPTIVRGCQTLTLEGQKTMAKKKEISAG
jgi:hypothetical protein